MQSASWQVEVDRATPAEWSEMLALFDDANLYQTSAYGGVRWGEKNLSRLVLKREGEVMGMAQVRIVRPSPLKFGMAYLRWGPLWERRGAESDPEVPMRLVRAIEHEYLEKRKLFLRVIPNAFPGTPRAASMNAAFCRFTAESSLPSNIYRTFVVDLSPSIDELRKGFNPKWRNKLSNAERNNLQVVVGTGMSEYRTFSQIYNQMRTRKAFETTVDIDEFGRIQEALSGSQRMQILICQDKEVPVAGLIVSAMGDSAIYLLGATSDDGLKSKGAYLLHWIMIQQLKEDGIRWYDLGGIDPDGNPGVYSFKKGFSGLDVSQMDPLVASVSAISSAIAKTGLVINRAYRTSVGNLKSSRRRRTSAEGN